MRFAVAASVLATGAMASVAPSGPPPVSTAYATEVVTVTSCGPEVTNCPADSTVVSTNTVPMSVSTVYSSVVHTVTDCGPEVTDCPAHSTIISTESFAVSTTMNPIGEPSKTPDEPAPAPPSSSATYGATSENSPVQPTSSEAVPAPSAPATTLVPGVPDVCVPTVSTTAITKSYTTVLTSVEYSTIEVPCATGPPQEPSASYTPPATSANSPIGGNSTVPSQPPVPTSGASSIMGSSLFAVVAGVVAFALA